VRPRVASGLDSVFAEVDRVEGYVIDGLACRDDGRLACGADDCQHSGPVVVLERRVIVVRDEVLQVLPNHWRELERFWQCPQERRCRGVGFDGAQSVVENGVAGQGTGEGTRTEERVQVIGAQSCTAWVPGAVVDVVASDQCADDLSVELQQRLRVQVV